MKTIVQLSYIMFNFNLQMYRQLYGRGDIVRDHVEDGCYDLLQLLGEVESCGLPKATISTSISKWRIKVF